MFAGFSLFTQAPTLVNVSGRGITGDGFMTSTVAGAHGGTATGKISERGHIPTRLIVRIHLLGSMRATSYLGDDVLPRAKKARAALGYLCLTPGAAGSRAGRATQLGARAGAGRGGARCAPGDGSFPGAKRGRAALGYLCLPPGARASRTRIATMLWDRVSADQARANFRQGLFDLTSAMGQI